MLWNHSEVNIADFSTGLVQLGFHPKRVLLGKQSNTSINEEVMLKQHTLLSETLLAELKIYEALGIYSGTSVKEPIMV